jgi:hypothetical protein
VTAYNQQAINLIWNELSSRGVKPEVAAGVIAGIIGESGAGLDPTAFNTQDPHGGAGGILQWNDTRLVGPTGLLAFARQNGVDVDPNTPTDSKKVPLAIQVKFMGHELDTKYSGVLKGLQSINNGEEGLTTWVNNMEVPADKTKAINQRRQYIAPVSGLLGKPAPAGADTANTGAGTGAAAAANPYAAAYAAQMSPQGQLSSSLGQALAGMGASMSTPSGGGGYMDASGDQPAIRSMAAQTDFTQPSNPLPAQYAGGAGGVGSQLGALAAQPAMTPLENPANAPSITQGAPGMTAMLGTLGTNATPSLFDQRGGNPLSPNPYRPTMRLA